MSEQARYILAKKIARGGMAEIYLGKQVGEDGFQRLCAIKRILPHFSQEAEFIQMFRDEAHICKRLQHANIVRVEGFEEVEGSYAIIMEYVDGADLRTLLHAVEQAKKRMPIAMACFIIAESARGLHYAHTKVDEITQQALGIVHRDISPQNILVSFEGEVKVTDFGIADAESKLTETRPGIVKGKYSYMSPEQISAKQVDARTDVFALSIVLWEMLSMRRLFQGDNEVDTIQRVKTCKIEPELRQLNQEVDEELDQIVKKGLARDPKKRYRTAIEFEKDLRRFMSRKYPDFTPEDLGSFLKQNMEIRRSESAADIKRTLTETNLKPARKATTQPPSSASGSQSSSSGTDSKRSIDLELGNAKDAPPLSIQRPLTANSNSGLRPMPRSQVQHAFASSNNSQRAAMGQNKPLNSPRMARRDTSLGKAIGLVIVAALALGLGIKAVLNMTAQPHPAQLFIRTQPPRIKVLIDNIPLNRGHYVHASSKSPLKITLKSGEHSLVVMRPGYATYRYEFTVDDGEKLTKDDIILKEKGTVAALKIRLRPGDEGVRIDINDGYFVTKLSTGSMLPVAPDVMVGHSYKMKVFSEEEKDKDKEKELFSCKFTPRASNWRAPNELLIDRKARKCALSGP